MHKERCALLTLVRSALLDSVALSAPGLEQARALLDVSLRETHFCLCVISVASLVGTV